MSLSQPGTNTRVELVMESKVDAVPGSVEVSRVSDRMPAVAAALLLLQNPAAART